MIYIQNRSPRSALEDKTPKEEFTDVKPKVSHLHIFGWLVYISVLEEKRTKVEPSNINGVFVGYKETTKAYMIFIHHNKELWWPTRSIHWCEAKGVPLTYLWLFGVYTCTRRKEDQGGAPKHTCLWDTKRLQRLTWFSFNTTKNYYDPSCEVWGEPCI